jgi:hypothetical protein
VVKIKGATREHRNDAYVDTWSWVHLATGAGMAWVMNPFWALVILILWEPIEIFVLSPLMWKWFGIEFGYETLKNSLSDIVFNIAGVLIGLYLLRALVDPPFILFG